MIPVYEGHAGLASAPQLHGASAGLALGMNRVAVLDVEGGLQSCRCEVQVRGHFPGGQPRQRRVSGECAWRSARLSSSRTAESGPGCAAIAARIACAARR